MKKILIISLLLLSTWMSAGAVDLNKENRDPKYVESIVNRSQKIVDKLGLTDKQVAEDVRNIIANRYFELNDIYEIRDAKVKKVKESGLTGEAKNEALKAAENEKDAALYRSHFAFPANLSLFLDEKRKYTLGWWKLVNLLWTLKIQIKNTLLLENIKDVSIIIWLNAGMT